MTILLYTLIILGLIFLASFIYNKKKYGDKDWQTLIEEERREAIERNMSLTEDQLVRKISFSFFKDNYPVFAVLRYKGTKKSLPKLIDLYHRNKRKFNSKWNTDKFDFLLMLIEISNRTNFDLPEVINIAFENCSMGNKIENTNGIRKKKLPLDAKITLIAFGLLIIRVIYKLLTS